MVFKTPTYAAWLLRQLRQFCIARGGILPLEQFQEKCETLFRPELRQNNSAFS